MIEIRAFTLNDYLPVYNLWMESNIILKKSDEFDEIKKKIEKDPDIFLLALENQEIIGALLGTWDGRRGWVNHLAVKETKRKQGIASKLLNELEQRLVLKGCLKINLLIQPNNSSVTEFYDKLGYKFEEVLFMSKEI